MFLFFSIPSYKISWLINYNLDSRIDVRQGIKVGPGKFDKKNKHRALNKHRAWKIGQKFEVFCNEKTQEKNPKLINIGPTFIPEARVSSISLIGLLSNEFQEFHMLRGFWELEKNGVTQNLIRL